MKKCCVTGHRSKSLPWGYNENSPLCFLFKLKLARKIKGLIKQGCLYFISGMAMGVDIIFAEIVIKLKKKYDLQLEVAIPCENQTRGWSEYYVERYNKILAKSDKISYISKNYFNGCMMKRNQYMVDNSDFVIAVYKKGTLGGTKNTIEYAVKQDKQIIYINL